MKINELKLTNYRNLSSQTFKFNQHLNIFVGDNGQGKTNIIEAITYLSSGRSFRVNKDEHLINYESEFAKIESVFDNQDSLQVVISNQGKYLTYNQATISKLSDFIGICNVVLFQPDDLQFFTQSPRLRRREIDYELGKSSKKYLNQLLVVNKLISDRNAYLKSEKIDEIFLEVIDKQLIENSIEIIKQRKLFIEDLSDSINQYFKELSGIDVKINLKYHAPINLESTNYHEAYSNKLKESYQRDKEFKMTHIGIHRDDYIFQVNDIPVVNVLSQGQRRLLIIAYKLALMDWFIKRNDVVPIFCMDDLFSELDRDKRLKVLDLLDERLQVFISTTDLRFIETKKEKVIYKITQGEGGIIHE